MSCVVQPLAHSEDNKSLFFPTPSCLCLDVYDEPVIISAGSSQAQALPYLSRLPEMGGLKLGSRAAVPELITVKRSDMTGR